MHVALTCVLVDTWYDNVMGGMLSDFIICQLDSICPHIIIQPAVILLLLQGIHVNHYEDHSFICNEPLPDHPDESSHKIISMKVSHRPLDCHHLNQIVVRASNRCQSDWTFDRIHDLWLFPHKYSVF